MCNELKLSNVKIFGEGLDPLSIVNQALDNLRMEKCDTAYCVFDQDEHSTYRNALRKIEENKINSINILAITSVPCFEYWILLHYERTSRSYKRSGKKSAGHQLITAVKKHIPLYSKGCKNIYKTTKPYLSTAITNAKLIDKEQIQNGTDNPSTQVYQLVEYLNQIKQV